MKDQNLRDLGDGIAAIFNSFTHSSTSAETPIDIHHIGLEAQRFQIWAHQLGLYQRGHVSLDYRVRDAFAVKDRLRDILQEIQQHLENMLAIAKGERVPAELSRDSDSLTSSSGSSSSSSFAATDDSSDQSIFDEVAFRLRSLTEHLDTLYSIATKIRNPKNRPRGDIYQLYKDIAPADRAAYRKEREEVETLTVLPSSTRSPEELGQPAGK